jgi:hypothetical protein
MSDRRNDTDPLFPPPPKPAEESDRAEKPITIKAGYTPDVFKVKTAESKGHATARYEGAARAPRAGGEDTQELQPPVIIDETKKEGFSGREIRALLAEIDIEKQRAGKTFAVEAPPKTSRKGVVLLVVGALVVICALVVLIAKSRTTTPDVVPVNVASSTPTPSASIEVPPVPASSSAVVASATPAVTSLNIQASSSVSGRAKPPSSGLALPPSSAHPTTVPSSPSSAHHVGDVPPGVL